MVTTKEKVLDVPKDALEREWDEIAVAYKEVMENFSFYRNLSSEIVSEVKGQKVLDLGCGTGAHLDMILQKNPDCEVIGVDSNQKMLGIAQLRLEQNHPGRKFRLHSADATTFNKEKGFDTVVSSNVLFNLENPMDYLDNAYRLLNPGGSLVLTSPQELVNMDFAENLMREDFRQQGIYEEKKDLIDIVWKVNRSFQGRSNVYREERMRDILLDFIGFEDIAKQKITYGNNFFFVAEKGRTLEDVSYAFSSDTNLLEKGFRLRYHWLFDRYGGIERQENEVYMDDCDNRSEGLFALEGENKVVGFVNYVAPGSNMPFDHAGLLENLGKQYGPVGACNGFYVVKTRQGRVGIDLIKVFMKAAATWDIGALVTEARIEISKGLKRYGWQTLETLPEGHGGKKLPVVLMFAPLKQYGQMDLQERLNS